jgi:hypothetical protein
LIRTKLLNPEILDETIIVEDEEETPKPKAPDAPIKILSMFEDLDRSSFIRFIIWAAHKRSSLLNGEAM